jgi:hypothetical protein
MAGENFLPQYSQVAHELSGLCLAKGSGSDGSDSVATGPQDAEAVARRLV